MPISTSTATNTLGSIPARNTKITISTRPTFSFTFQLTHSDHTLGLGLCYNRWCRLTFPGWPLFHFRDTLGVSSMCRISGFGDLFWSSRDPFWIPTPPSLMALLFASLSLYPWNNTPNSSGNLLICNLHTHTSRTPAHTSPGWVGKIHASSTIPFSRGPLLSPNPQCTPYGSVFSPKPLLYHSASELPSSSWTSPNSLAPRSSHSPGPEP